MPKKGQTTYRYHCKVCGQEYSSFFEDEAKSFAQKCESNEPRLHTLKVGDVVREQVSIDATGEWVWANVKIESLFVQKKTHHAGYAVQILKGSVAPGMRDTMLLFWHDGRLSMYDLDPKDKVVSKKRARP